MAFQIGGTTIINNSKQIQNIGGKGGIISGTFTIGGPQGFGRITCSSFRGHVIGYISFDNNDSGDLKGSMSCSLGWSKGNSSTSFSKHIIWEVNNNVAIISQSPQTSSYTWSISNYYPTRTIYYTFWYSGSTVPTITIT